MLIAIMLGKVFKWWKFCKKTPNYTFNQFPTQVRPANEILVTYPIPPAAYFIPPYQVSAPLFVPVAPADRPFLINNPTWSQLLIPPSFVGLFNRRLTTNDFTTNNLIPQQTFQFNLNQENDNGHHNHHHHHHRQRPVSVITLSSDEDDEQPPRVAPPHPQPFNSNSNRSNIKRERISIDHRTQYGMGSSSLNFDRLNSHDGLLGGFVSSDPRSIEMLMYGVNGQIDRNDIRLY